jgi:hypothetical protein
VTCSNCGGSTNDWKDGQPCPQCAVQPLEIKVSDSIHVSAEFTAEGKSGDRTTGLRHESDDKRRSVSVDLESPSRIKGSITAPPRHNESGTQEVCDRLIPSLNQKAGFNKWDRCDCRENEHEIKDEKDCLVYATGDSPPLRVQVVRPGNSFWKPMQKDLLKACYDLPVDELAVSIQKVIDRKANHYASTEKKHLLLAVDMLETPWHAFEEIKQRLDAASIESSGFREIWLVGVTPELCIRIHPK